MVCSQPDLLKLDQFFADFPTKSLKKGETVLEIDTKLTHLIYLTKGFVRQYAVSKQGEEFTLNIFKPHCFFPLNLAFHQKINPYYFKAFSKVEFNLAPINQVVAFLKQNPDVLFDLTVRLTSGINGLLFRMESLVFGSARERVAAALYLSAARFRANSNESKFCQNQNKSSQVKLVDFKLTHEQIAFMTGLTRETVSVEMTKLKQVGLVAYQKQRICLLKPEELKEISSLPFYQK